eukprot:g15367.t1
MFPSALLDRLRSGLIQLLLRLSRGLPASLTAPPMILPVVAAPPQAPRRPREVDIRQGLTYLALVLVVFGAYFAALWIADEVSAPLALVAFIVEVHAVYLAIYGLEYFGVIDGERRDGMISRVENLCPIGNFFSPTPPTMILPRRMLTFLARFIVRAVSFPPEQEENSNSSVV